VRGSFAWADLQLKLSAALTKNCPRHYIERPSRIAPNDQATQLRSEDNAASSGLYPSNVVGFLEGREPIACTRNADHKKRRTTATPDELEAATRPPHYVAPLHRRGCLPPLPDLRHSHATLNAARRSDTRSSSERLRPRAIGIPWIHTPTSFRRCSQRRRRLDDRFPQQDAA